MAKSSTMVSLPQMVDLALNCPEVGAVNFNILHALLHVLIQQIEGSGINVEFRGNDSDRLQKLITTGKPGPSLTLTEYIVLDGGQDRKLKKKKKLRKKSNQQLQAPATDVRNSQDVIKKEKLIRTIEQRKNSKEAPIENPPPLTSPPDSQTSFQTIVVVEAIDQAIDTPHFTVAITKTHFNEIENEIAELRGKIKELTELPGNLGLIDAIRTDKSSPILDMFQILNLTKRLDGTDASLQKLATMIEDLAKEHVNGGGSPQLLEKASELKLQVDSGKDLPVSKVESIERRVTELEKVLHSAGGENPTRVQQKSSDKSQEKASPATTTESKQQQQQIAKNSKTNLAEIDLTKLPPTQAIAIIQTELENLHNLIENSKDMGEFLKELELMKGKLGTDAGPADSTNQIQKGSDDPEGAVDTEKLNDNSQIGALQNRIVDLEKEVAAMLDKVNLGLPGGDTAVNEDNFLELCDKFKQMEEEMSSIGETALKLDEEKTQRRQAMDVLVEQIDLLKIVKADREDLEDALDNKADACAINRKVSHEQFNTVCDDLSKGIEEAMLKLTQQEDLWQQTLDEIQREIGSKLDKLELNALRDFVTKKLKFLQDKFKNLASLKQETEAAGTRSHLLKNVNCISCDKDVVMRKELDPTLKPQPYSLKAPKNIAPYLAYELDQLRKQQKCLPGGRNLNYLERSLKDHRHCGGSHTITTPQQRVTRMGNFMDQWDTEMGAPGSKGDQKMSVKGSMTVQGDIYSAANEGKIDDPEDVSKIESDNKRLSQKKIVSEQALKRLSARGSRTLETEPTKLEKDGSSQQLKMDIIKSEQEQKLTTDGGSQQATVVSTSGSQQLMKPNGGSKTEDIKKESSHTSSVRKIAEIDKKGSQQSAGSKGRVIKGSKESVVATTTVEPSQQIKVEDGDNVVVDVAGGETLEMEKRTSTNSSKAETVVVKEPSIHQDVQGKQSTDEKPASRTSLAQN